MALMSTLWSGVMVKDEDPVLKELWYRLHHYALCEHR